MLGAWKAFVNVSERGSFTEGAAATRVPQSVVSRRIAALEKHLGERLFDRSSRGALLTQFGRDMLPLAKRLVRLADDMEYEAERAKLNPLRLAVPDSCTVHDLARLVVEGQQCGIYLDFHTAPPPGRAELARSREVHAALTAVPSRDAVWSVRLGVAGATELPVETVYIETLRVGRAGQASRRRRLLNLRHEIGVVEHADGQIFGVVVLTESSVPASNQPGAEALMAQVARTLRDQLRHS